MVLSDYLKYFLLLILSSLFHLSYKYVVTRRPTISNDFDPNKLYKNFLGTDTQYFNEIVIHPQAHYKMNSQKLTKQVNFDFEGN